MALFKKDKEDSVSPEAYESLGRYRAWAEAEEFYRESGAEGLISWLEWQRPKSAEEWETYYKENPTMRDRT